MGDIDDFFAKKDKKKKGTKKFSKANTDVIAKNLLDSDRKEMKEMERQEKEVGTQLIIEKPIEVVGTLIPSPPEDEEWEDYRENKKDYSGLKIENLNIDDLEDDEEDEETEINEDGEVVKVRKDESGPWSKLAGAPGGTHETHQQDLIAEPEPSIQTPNVVGGSYVPPHMRGGGAPAAAEPTRTTFARGRKRDMPDITSEVYFPSLSSAAEDAGPKGAWGKATRGSDDGGHFEEVRESGKQNFSRQTEAPRLALGNKFDALRGGD